MSGTQQRLEERLRQQFAPVQLDIVDESAQHAGHAGAASGGAHFQVRIVSAAFDGKSLLEQHRLVNAALKDLIGGEIHALGLKTVPASEWSVEKES